ncbi:MAG: hypothetical protein NUV72_08505, partial [Bauldia sp.]|nr:hypothetical protein [Bauldia sp.]
MKPIVFQQANAKLTGTDGVAVLPVFRNGREIISCWRPSWRERIALLWTGRVYLRVLAGVTHGPVSIEARSPFT